jgi:predicted Zn-dependent protease
MRHGTRQRARTSRRGLSYGPRRGRGGKLRLLIGAGMLVFALISYFGSRQYNEITGENQHLALTAHQEIALGLQALPEIVQKHGGQHPDAQAQALVDEVGRRLVQSSVARETEWQFDFHLLRDDQTVNAFALPGGQCFITSALFSRLETEGQLAGVLGHEIGHVLARHGAQRMAKSKFTQGLIGAVAVGSGSGSAAQISQMVGQMVNMKYGRDDELQSDELGVKIMYDAGYDPRAMIGVMEILEESGGGAGKSEFFSTHPSPDNRVGRIEEAIAGLFPEDVPPGLTP